MPWEGKPQLVQVVPAGPVLSSRGMLDGTKQNDLLLLLWMTGLSCRSASVTLPRRERPTIVMRKEVRHDGVPPQGRTRHYSRRSSSAASSPAPCLANGRYCLGPLVDVRLRRVRRWTRPLVRGAADFPCASRAVKHSRRRPLINRRIRPGSGRPVGRARPGPGSADPGPDQQLGLLFAAQPGRALLDPPDHVAVKREVRQGVGVHGPS